MGSNSPTPKCQPMPPPTGRRFPSVCGTNLDSLGLQNGSLVGPWGAFPGRFQSKYIRRHVKDPSHRFLQK